MSDWFKKKEFSIDDCVPVTIKEVEIYRKKIRYELFWKPYIGDNASKKIKKKKLKDAGL